ncbi:hypothetical protein Btru_057177 [Bulinus truncatus]|nr:hypothetical protein Btru_057177 [Bulinus truncatus]
MANGSFDVSYDDMRTAELVLANILAPALTVLAVMSNGVSLVIFSRLGLSDGISISFFTLTVSDFVFAASSMVTLVVVLFMGPSVDWSVDPLALAILLLPLNRMCYDLSNTITCFIAVTRCCCVAMPLRFKSTLTNSRTCAVLAIITLAFVIEFSPMFASQGLQTMINPATNSSRMVIWFSRNRDEIAKILYETLNRNAVLILTFAISLVSFIVIIHKLKESASFRRSFKPSAFFGDPEIAEKRPRSRESLHMTRVEIQTVKGVSVVLLITLSCNLPVLCISYSRLILPDLAMGKPLNNAYFLISNVSNFVIVVKSSFHRLIYYKFNSRYRLAFWSILPCGRTKVSRSQNNRTEFARRS